MALITDTTTRTMLFHELGLTNTRMGLDKSYARGCSNQNDEVLKGSWVFKNKRNGLRMHYGTFQSLRDLTVSFELPPGISFTIIFEGSLSFALGPKQYTLGENFTPVECSSFSVSRPEIVSRKITRNEYVRKLNVFAEREWLERLCNSTSDYECLNRAFQKHACAKFWKPSSQLLRAAKQVMQQGSDESLCSSFEQEASVLSLLSLMMSELLKSPEVHNGTDQFVHSQNSHPDPVVSYIDASNNSLVTLDGIAEEFNMSVSTLQRRFKSRHGVTVIDYIRNNKLDEAKRLLVANSLSIGEIAFLAGYKHPSNFLAAFKKRFEISAGEYRRNHLNSSC